MGNHLTSPSMRVAVMSDDAKAVRKHFDKKNVNRRLADPEKADFGWTAMHYAMQYCRSTAVPDALLSLGADLTLVDKDGWAPLHWP